MDKGGRYWDGDRGGGWRGGTIIELLHHKHEEEEIEQ